MPGGTGTSQCKFIEAEAEKESPEFVRRGGTGVFGADFSENDREGFLRKSDLVASGLGVKVLQQFADYGLHIRIWSRRNH